MSLTRFICSYIRCDGIQLTEVASIEVLDDPLDKEDVFQKEQHLVTPEHKKRL